MRHIFRLEGLRLEEELRFVAKRVGVGLLILLLFVLAPLWQVRAFPARTSAEARARELLERLSPAERIGQLFLVAYPGDSVGPDAPIYKLIAERRIGGVILLRSNGNIPAGDDALQALQGEIAALQNAAWEGGRTLHQDPVTGKFYVGTFVPLFVATVQDGDGYPNDQVLDGVAPLPSPMAIGATWKPELARKVGAVLGEEMAAIGFNMLLGPSLDVLATPHPGKPGDLGVNAFGGDPYWVGKMGKAYIRGVHQGSHGHLAVVAKHFPGYSGSDRSPEDEVATVRKSLEQLKQIELAPFFAVTSSNASPEMVADGLLVSHIRYQGFQGNIRATTRPVSLDPQAFAALMALQPFAEWRKNGGLAVSDDLGSRAIHRFYDPTEKTFNAPLVARDALLAGNDVLYLGIGFRSPGDDSQYQTVLRTLDFFLPKYHTDPAFAQRVDAAALRVLTLKLKLYPSFTYSSVTPRKEDLNSLNKKRDVVFQVAQQAATLISPSPTDLDAVLPTPPQPRDRILFLTDDLLYRECADCPQRHSLSPESLRNAVLRLYGPKTSGQMRAGNMFTLTFAELQKWLEAPDKYPEVEAKIRLANWIVVGLLDMNPARPESLAFRRLLDQQSALLRSKHVVVFAFHAPYYLDATDISKLSAYYGLYSKTTPFVEAAVRLLFRELAPRGALPVSVPGVGYDLITATSPDPKQVIQLEWDFPAPKDSAKATPIPADKPFRATVGQTLPVRTSVIVDHNGNPVPDGTVVRFLITTPGGEQVQQSVEVTTVDGVARASFQISTPGLWEIKAQSDPATKSKPLQVEVPGAAESTATVVLPTASPSPSPTVVSTPAQAAVAPVSHNRLDFVDYLGALLVSLGIGWLACRWMRWRGVVRWGIRVGLLAFIGGMGAYLFLALSPHTSDLLARFGYGTAPLVALLGGVIGVGFGVLWIVIFGE